MVASPPQRGTTPVARAGRRPLIWHRDGQSAPRNVLPIQHYLHSPERAKTLKGVEGFHSQAFGPYADLCGLALADTAEFLGIEVSDVAARARLDVRGRRRMLIQAYQQELLA